MNYLVFSGVQGYYDEFMKALSQASYDPATDILVSLGDYLVGGPNPKDCLNFITSASNPPILIKGDTDINLISLIRNKHATLDDYMNGTYDTAKLLADLYSTAISELMLEEVEESPNWQYYQNHIMPYEEKDSLIFTHGWIPCRLNFGWYFPLYDWHAGNLITSITLNGMYAWHQNVTIENKTICCGHTPASWGFKYLRDMKDLPAEPFVDKGIVSLGSDTPGVIYMTRLSPEGEILYKTTEQKGDKHK